MTLSGQVRVRVLLGVLGALLVTNPASGKASIECYVLPLHVQLEVYQSQLRCKPRNSLVMRLFNLCANASPPPLQEPRR